MAFLVTAAINTARSNEDLATAFRRSHSSISTTISEPQDQIQSEEKAEDLWSSVYQGDITEIHLRSIQQELNLIQLCWEKIEMAWNKHRGVKLESYANTSEKEKLLLWYAANFRKQFHCKFLNRKPILMVCNNECGVQKMVCTTIRPTSLRYEALQNVHKCADFLADHIKYLPLINATSFVAGYYTKRGKTELLPPQEHQQPEEIVSPGEVLARQAGHCFELATLLASILIGASYNAFVVSGYATREICLNDTSRTEYPFQQSRNGLEEETDSALHSKYELEPSRDLRSQFLLGQEKKEKARETAARMAQLRAEEQAIREFEKPPPDSLATHRRHAWVLVLPSKDVREACFVEPASGTLKTIDDPEYHGVDSVWNHANYWIAVGQQRLIPCTNILLGLDNLSYWEHFLLGESTLSSGSATINDDHDNDCNSAKKEKHLDMPSSWVKKINLPHADFERRFVDCQKVVRYRKCVVELFSPYSDIAGLSTRVTRFTDYDCHDVLSIEEQFCNRADHLYFSAKKGSQIHHQFHHGREDALKEFWFEDVDKGFPTNLRFQFYNNSRQEGLWSLCKEPYFMTENFKGREDLLYFRHVIFNEDPAIENSIMKIVEKYHRNPSKPVAEDAAMMEYDFESMKVHIVYQYGDEEITAGTRELCLKEMKQITSYDPSPGAVPPRPLTLYYWLQSYLNQSEKAQQNVRLRQQEIEGILIKRGRELAEPQLVISPFDEERNEEAKECFKERDRKLHEEAARDLSLETDLLAPYIAALPISECNLTLSASIARNIYAKCLQDWKNILITRANDIQRQFEQACHEMKDWAESGSEIDSEFSEKNRPYFKLHCLNVRLMRHKELAPQRYLALEACLRVDKRLANAFYL